MIRLFKKDDSGYKDFTNGLFSTNLCTFNFLKNTVTISTVDYYINKIVDMNESVFIVEQANDKLRTGKVEITAGVDNQITFATTFDSANYTLSFTVYNANGTIGADITNRLATGFKVNPLEDSTIEYQAIYIS